VRGEVIVPGGLYELEFMDASGACVGTDLLSSDLLTLATSNWGDVGDGCPGGICGPPDGVVDFSDISAAVDKFMNRPNAPSKSRVDIAPALADGVVDFVDISRIVEGFRGAVFPYPAPSGNLCP